MTILFLVARFVLAAVFGVAAVAKAADQEGTRRAMEDFRVPRALVRPVAVLLPLAEFVTAILLIVPATLQIGALAAIGLLGAFTLLLVVTLLQGRQPECNCFGQMSAAPIGWTTVLRNVLLGGVAVIALMGADTSFGDAFDWYGALSSTERGLSIAIGVLGAMVIAQSLFSYALLKQNGRILLRLDEGGTSASETDASRPAQGLPVGTRAPEFSLAGLHGETLTLGALLADGKQLMLVFTDPSCGPCNALMPDIAKWHAEHADKLNIAVISEKDRAANQEKADRYELKRVLLQEKREVAEAYRYVGTPSAVLVAPDGTVASAVAGGGPGITSLVRQAVGPSRQAAARGRGLDVGSEAPPVRLPDLAGDEVDLADYRGRKVMLLFWRPSCGFCQKMLPQLRESESAVPPGAPAIVVISQGSIAENIDQGIRSEILLDNDLRVASSFNATGTPMAVLIDAHGRIASEVAVGAPAVMEMAGASI